MSDVKLVFMQRKSWVAYLVSFGTFSRINHVGILIDGKIYNMFYQWGKDKPEMVALNYAEQKDDILKEITLEQITSEQARAWHVNNSSRRYDLLRTLLWSFRNYTSKNREESWNCVEHCRNFAEFYGYSLNYDKNMSPGKFYKLFSAKFS